MRKTLAAGVTLAGTLMLIGCGSDNDSFNGVVLLPTATQTNSSSTSTNSNSSTSTGTSTTTTSAAPTYYVQLGAASNGSGSQASPFNTLSGAVETAPEGATLIVLRAANGASVTTDVTLKNGQKLLGQGAPQQTGSAKVIPAGTYPRITGRVSLADGNVVSGLEFVSPPASAIVGVGIANADINNVKVTGSGSVAAISLIGVSGVVSVKENDLSRAGAAFPGRGEQPPILTVSPNFQLNSSVNKRTSNRVAATSSFDVSGNHVTGSGYEAIGVAVGSLDEASGSRVSTQIGSLTVSNNVVTNVQGTALSVGLGNDPGNLTANGNRVTQCSQGITVFLQGTFSGTADVSGNQIQVSDTALDIDNEALSSGNTVFATNALSLNGSFGPVVSPSPAPTATSPDDTGIAINYDGNPAVRTDIRDNVITGASQAFYVTPSRYGQNYTGTLGYLRVTDNQLATRTTTNSPTYSDFNTESLNAAAVALRGNVAPNEVFRFNTPGETGALSKFAISANRAFQFVFTNSNSVTPNPIQVERFDPTSTNSPTPGTGLIENGLNMVNASATPAVEISGTPAPTSIAAGAANVP